MDKEGRRIDRLSHRWFVVYNPLYFFSALSVLGGVFVLSRGLDELGWRQGKILLTAVLEIYQLLLIAAAALLYRAARRHRPAVILALLTALFLFDCTLQTEALASIESPTTAMVWVALKAVELLALLRALRLRPAPVAVLVPLAAITLIAAAPQLLDRTAAGRQEVHLLATWAAAGLAGWLLGGRPAVVSKRRLGRWGEVVLARAEITVRRLWLALVLLHLVAWMAIYDVVPTAALLVPWLVLAALTAGDELHVWITGASAAALALTHPPAAAPAMLAVAAALAWRAWCERRHRLLVGAVTAVYLAGWTAGWSHGPLPQPGLWLTLAAAALLVFVAWRLRLPAALVPLLAGLPKLGERLPEPSTVQLGIGLLAAGFVSLLAGVALDWSRRAGRCESPAGPADGG